MLVLVKNECWTSRLVGFRSMRVLTGRRWMEWNGMVVSKMGLKIKIEKQNSLLANDAKYSYFIYYGFRLFANIGFRNH